MFFFLAVLKFLFIVSVVGAWNLGKFHVASRDLCTSSTTKQRNSYATAVSKGKPVIALVLSSLLFCSPTIAVDNGANDGANSKILKGGASTLQQGIAKSITRGVNLDGSDFHGQNLKGVAFQQSIVRKANFRDANLYSASFFDATLDGSDFENADMTLANIELAQVNNLDPGHVN